MNHNRPHETNKVGGATAPPTVMRGPARLRLVPPGSARRRQPIPLGVAPIGEPVLIGLTPQDARHHLHVPGPTGTGKSTLLLNMAISQARAGRGVVVFDPGGDLVRDLLDRLPPQVAGRLVVIDPDETEAPPAVNLFDLGADPETVADQLVGVMAKVWAAYWGPRTDDLARHAVLTLAHLPGSTLADLPPLLADPAHRRRVLGMVHGVAAPAEYAGLAGFWSWYDSLTPAAISVQAGPLLSKLRAVLSRRFAAGLFGTGASTFGLTEVLDGGVLLVRLPPTLGDDTVRLVGSLLLAALLHAASGRADQPEAARLDAMLMLDEAATFLNLPVGVDVALAQARKLHLCLVLAHQHLDQLTPRMLAAIDSNARNKIFFSLSPGDADKLGHHVAPYFAPADLTARDAYGIVCRLVIDGHDAEPFSLTTRPMPPAWPGRAETLRSAARARGLPAAVRRELAQARRLGPAAPDRAQPPQTRPPAGAPAAPVPAPSAPVPIPPGRTGHLGAPADTRRGSDPTDLTHHTSTQD